MNDVRQPHAPPPADDAGDPLHVAVVDDEEAILRALKRELRGQGFTVTTFNDPHAALDAIIAGNFALVISDNRMPGMTGVELLEQVKRARPETVRIMLTGYTEAEAAIHAINEGEIQRFVTKPWEREQLLAHINEGLEVHRLRRANRALKNELQARGAGPVRASTEAADIDS